MKELVSVIVPVYNVEKYLERCLKSICAQTYSNLEILVIDDGSTDASGELVQKIALQDERIRVFRQRNQGVSAARNLGLAKAMGTYVTFVDGDDYLDPEAIFTEVSKLQEAEADLLNFEYRKVSEEGALLEECTFLHGIRELDTEEEKLSFIMEELLPYRVGYEVCDKLFCMDLIREYAVSFSMNSKIGEDMGFILTYCLYAKRFVGIEGRFYNYCIRDDSAMAKAKVLGNNLEGYTGFLQGVYEKIENDGTFPFLQKMFPLVFACAMENVNRGYTVSDVEEAVRKLTCREFYVTQAKAVADSRKEMLTWYDEKKRKAVWRFFLAMAKDLGDSQFWQRCYLLIYDAYRFARRKELLRDIKQL